MKGISVICYVHNEEKRIENFLLNFIWSDDLIVVDKSSQDKTREIVLKYTKNLIIIPYSEESDDVSLAVKQAKHEWILFVTASDIIHPQLVEAMLGLINQPGFDYDFIRYPYAFFAFGISDKRLPWFLSHKGLCIRKDAIHIGGKIHHEIDTPSKKYYTIPYHPEYNLSHLTHETLETFFERHLRYIRLETEKYNETPKAAFRKSLSRLFRSIRIVAISKRTFLLGWDGIALSLAYISYFIMEFLAVWQKYRGKGPEVYAKVRKQSLKEWQDYYKSKRIA